MQEMPHVAVALDAYLDYTQSWIHRQATGIASRASLVLCKERKYSSLFPFSPICVSPDRDSLVWRKIRGKAWRIFRHFPPRLSRQQRCDYYAAIRDHRISLVHAHFGMMGVAIRPLCRTLKLPLMVTVHGYDIKAVPRRWPAYTRELRKLWDSCVYVLVISRDMIRAVQDLGCPAEKIRLSYLGAPTGEIAFVDRRDREGPVHFLHAGRLSETKGVVDLVRAFRLAFPQPNEAVLDIVGEGPEKAEIERAIHEGHLANPVFIHGRMIADELESARTKADVFVLNCQTTLSGTTEGLPISTLEAACSGLPAISTRHGGVPESIIDGETGILVEERNVNALASALRQMLDRNRRLAMGRSARDFMEREFDVRACNAVLGQLYREAVSSMGPK